MQTGRSLAKLAIILTTTAPLASCGFFAELTAMRTFKDANLNYGRAAYAEAIEEYEEVVTVLENGAEGELSQTMSAVYFYIANSYDNLYKPAQQGDPINDAFLGHAAEYYRLGAERSFDPSLRKLSMQYLVSVYGSDRLNDPSATVPILLEMIELDPTDPDNYFALARLCEEAGLLDEARDVMQTAREVRPDDPTVYLQLAGFFNRTGDFDQTIEALQQRAAIEPNNPEAYYTISTYYWEKAFRDFRITQDVKAEYVQSGIEAADRAIELNERYVDALVYKNILLRMQANMTEDVDEQETLIAEADELRNRATQLQEEAQGRPAAG